jgi:enoyl-CoA hydratase/carnithine racemase
LVNKILPLDQLLPFAQKQAAKLAALPASSIRMTKRLMKGNHTAAVEAKVVEEMKHFGEMLTSPEAKEAFTAFFEKRKPDFTRFS